MATEESAAESLFDAEALRRLVEEMERSGIEELEMAEGGSRVLIKRASLESTGDERSRRLADRNADRRSEAAGLPIIAPLTGMFYSRPQPSEPPYVSVGDHVERGQTVALIETMKLFNEVSAEISGKLLSVSAVEGGLVEAGQPLMYVRPEEGDAA